MTHSLLFESEGADSFSLHLDVGLLLRVALHLSLCEAPTGWAECIGEENKLVLLLPPSINK